MNIQAKKSFAMVDYKQCNPNKCSPDNGVCAAALACSYKALKQIDGPYEPPMVFNDQCMGCWDCIEACPLNAIYIKEIT